MHLLVKKTEGFGVLSTLHLQADKLVCSHKLLASSAQCCSIDSSHSRLLSTEIVLLITFLLILSVIGKFYDDVLLSDLTFM